jgi:hypothetical protein
MASYPKGSSYFKIKSQKHINIQQGYIKPKQNESIDTLSFCKAIALILSKAIVTYSVDIDISFNFEYPSSTKQRMLKNGSY